MYELKRELKDNGNVHTIIRGEFKIIDIPPLYYRTENLEIGDYLFEIVEHDIFFFEGMLSFPYGDSIGKMKEILKKFKYSFLAFYCCNELSLGICNQMKVMLSSDTVVVKVFTTKDAANSWLKEMRFIVDA